MLINFISLQRDALFSKNKNDKSVDVITLTCESLGKLLINYLVPIDQ